MCKDEMKKKDLKNGYSVKLRDGDRYLVLLGNPLYGYGIHIDILSNMKPKGDYIKLIHYDDDLIFSVSHEVKHKYDIVAVYRPQYIRDILDVNKHKLIWKREEEEDSFDDISKRLDETCLRLQTVLDEMGEGIELLKKELNIK